MLSPKFLTEFKRATEAIWDIQEVNPIIYGLQFQRGTRWNPGLPSDAIAEYESVLDVRFPHDLRALLPE